MTSKNPVLETIFNPDGNIPFHRFTAEDYKAALEQIRPQVEDVLEKIRALSPNEITFENVIVPLSEDIYPLKNFFTIIDYHHSVLYSDDIGDAFQEISTVFTDIETTIYRDDVIASFVNDLYNNKSKLGLDKQNLHLLEKTYKEFRDQGAFLSDTADKDTYVEIENKLSEVTKSFNTNLREGIKQNAILISSEEMLKGLPSSLISSFAVNAEEAGEDGWLIYPERFLVEAVLETAENPELRKTAFFALKNTGKTAPYNNDSLIQEIAELRHQKALLLGYNNYAEKSVSVKMARTPSNVMTFIKDLERYASDIFDEQVEGVMSFAKQHGASTIEPWDLPYWVMRYREDFFEFDYDLITPYLEVETVISGMIRHFERLFGIRFERTDTLDKFHPDIETYNVIDQETGEPLSVMTLDLFERSGIKRDGAFCEVIQPLKKNAPNNLQIAMNMAKPKAGEKAFMSFSDMRTIYHEAGHAIHGLFAKRAQYFRFSSEGNSPDFVELPSQLMENWVRDPAVFSMLTSHYKTGEPMPQDLAARLVRAESFFTPVREALMVAQNATRDMGWAMLDTFSKTPDVTFIDGEFSTFTTTYSDYIRGYDSTRFSHLFNKGESQYAAGYYCYGWAEMLDKDAYEQFKKTGDIYDRETAQRLREILEMGDSLPNEEIYRHFNPNGPDITPLIDSLKVIEATQGTPHSIATVSNQRPSLASPSIK